MAGGTLDEKNGYDRPSSGYACVQQDEIGPLTRNYHRLSDWCKYRKAEIVIAFLMIVIIIIGFWLGLSIMENKKIQAVQTGTSVPSDHQQDVIKCPPVTCPPDWIGHQGHCYKLSGEEKNWMESQNFCILHNATLAKITGKDEMAFLRKFTRNHVVWIGLRRESNHPWKWLDGANATLKVLGIGGDCAFLDDDDDDTASSGRCTTEHHYICKINK